MNEKTVTRYLSLVAVILIIVCITVFVGCNPINSIDNTFKSLTNNYTLEIIENSINGIKNYVRKYDGNKVYLNYNDEIQMYFDKKGGTTDVYTGTANGKWNKESMDSSLISYEMTANYAFNAFKLAKDDLTRYFYREGKIYTLYNNYFNEVFDGEGKGLKCVIERIDGKTTIRAVFKEGREDTLSVINVNKTKINLPEIK